VWESSDGRCESGANDPTEPSGRCSCASMNAAIPAMTRTAPMNTCRMSRLVAQVVGFSQLDRNRDVIRAGRPHAAYNAVDVPVGVVRRYVVLVTDVPFYRWGRFQIHRGAR